MSDFIEIKFGVPQGSIFGPKLFNIYINNYKYSLLSSAGIVQYSDDTTLCFSTRTIENAEMPFHLTACVQYFDSFYFKTNLGKNVGHYV